MHAPTDRQTNRTARLFGLVPTLAVALCTLLPAPAGAQGASDPPSARALADSLEEGVTRAALRGEGERLDELRRLAERARELHPEDPWLRHYHGYTLYRIGLAAMEEGPQAADAPLERAQRVLQASARQDSIPESFALLASTLGMRIAADPEARAQSMGRRSQQALRAAEAVGPENPRVWLVKGVNAFHTPEQYGGGAETAREHLEKALALLREEAPDAPEPSWGRAEAHAYLGQVHARQGRTEEARAQYEKALEVEPEYAWVKKRLLPALEGGG